MIEFQLKVSWLQLVLFVFILFASVGSPVNAQVSYYPFELDLDDRIGTNNLINAGGPSLTNDLNNCRRVLSFDGNGHVKDDTPMLAISDEFTLSFWMKADELDADQKIIGQAAIVDFNFRGFVIGVEDSLIKAEIFGTETQGFASMTNFTLAIFEEESRITNDWTHIGFSVDQTNTLKVFINGVLKKYSIVFRPSQL